MGLNPGYHRFSLGEIQCTVLYDGWLDHPLEGFLGGPPQEVAAYHRHSFLPETRWPMDENCLHLRIGGESVLIDTGLGHHKWFGSGTGRLPESMAEAGIDPASITLVLLTHADTDHVFGLLDDQGRKTFPNARIAISRREFDHWVDGQVINGKSPNPDWRRVTEPTLRAYAEGAIWLEDSAEILPGVTAVATPGHSPGHFAFRIESAGEVLYVFGDAVHHQLIELAEPDWAFLWDFDPAEGLRSKAAVLARACAEGALCHGFHFQWPGLGRLAPQGEGRYLWVPNPQMF